MAEITVSNLIKSFEIGSNVLDGLSFTVNPGERVGILGPNGCGKTTLFRILTGALDYDEGQISITPGKRIGLISQSPVFPEFRQSLSLSSSQVYGHFQCHTYPSCTSSRIRQPDLLQPYT